MLIFYNFCPYTSSCICTTDCKLKIKEFVVNGYKSKHLPLPVSLQIPFTFSQNPNILFFSQSPLMIVNVAMAVCRTNVRGRYSVGDGSIHVHSEHLIEGNVF